MKEKINRLARGVLDTEPPLFRVNPESVDLPVQSGSVVRTELGVESANGAYLKGLLYSDHIRVKVLKPSFGGTRIREAVEIDARNTDPGDVIAGTFTFVTDGGEKTVPFSFRVTDGSAGEALGKLKTLEAFALIAKADPESALRIFEYREFTSAPFLRDPRLESLYEAFRKGPDRAMALEEFLVAAGAKKPALVRAETARVDLEPGSTEGTITLVLVRAGCFRLSASAEGGFLVLSRNTIHPKDLASGSCIFPFSVNSAELHDGKNEGRIVFTAGAFSFTVPVTAYRSTMAEEEAARARRLEKKRHFAAYLDARVSYELNSDAAGELSDRMTAELMAAGAAGGEYRLLTLLLAEASLLGGSVERCRKLLEEVRSGQAVRPARGDSSVRTEGSSATAAGETDTGGTSGEKTAAESTPSRETPWLPMGADGLAETLDDALSAILSGSAAERNARAAKIEQTLREGKAPELLPVLLLLNPEIREDTESFLALLRLQFEAGSRSPFLFASCARLFEAHPERILDLGPLELSVLRFSLRHGLPGKETAEHYVRAAADAKSTPSILFLLLSELYQRYPSDTLIMAACRCLIRSDTRSEEAFAWFERGIERGVRLTGLNEYLIYSMPDDYVRALPHEVYLYFAYDNRLDDTSREKLYESLCRFQKNEPALWQEYQKQISRYALEKLLEGRVNRRLAVLYRAVLCDDMIDRKLAAVLPGILNARLVHVDSDRMRYIVVVYPELSSVQKSRLEGGTVCVPVYTDDAMFVFEDAYGNRAADISWKAEEICAMPGLERKCRELDPDGPVPLLERVRAVTENVRNTPRALEPDEVRTLRYALEHMKLSAAFAAEIRALLADNADECIDLFLSTDLTRFSAADRNQIFSALLRAGRWNQAYALMSRGLVTAWKEDELALLCSKIVIEKQFAGEETLLKLCARVFLSGRADAAVLDYLCENYNDSSAHMNRLLGDAVHAGVPTYDLAERLTAQMLFTGEKADVESVFQVCRSEGKASDLMCRAFAADRCGECIKSGKAPEGELAEFLEKMALVSDRRREIPVLFRISLLSHYAECETLNEQEKVLAEELLGSLLDEGLTFPYYKKLAKNIPVPDDVLDATLVSYRGTPGEDLMIRMRIQPDAAEERVRKMPEMFYGIYVQREILFAGETLEYEIWRAADLENADTGRPLAAGSVPCSAPRERVVFDGKHIGSRYGCLNDLTEKLKTRDEAGLRAEMEAFAAEEDLAGELFSLDDG